jgi:hypothetical protein
VILDSATYIGPTHLVSFLSGLKQGEPKPDGFARFTTSTT